MTYNDYSAVPITLDMTCERELIQVSCILARSELPLMPQVIQLMTTAVYSSYTWDNMSVRVNQEDENAGRVLLNLSKSTADGSESVVGRFHRCPDAVCHHGLEPSPSVIGHICMTSVGDMSMVEFLRGADGDAPPNITKSASHEAFYPSWFDRLREGPMFQKESSNGDLQRVSLPHSKYPVTSTEFFGDLGAGADSSEERAHLAYRFNVGDGDDILPTDKVQESSTIPDRACYRALKERIKKIKGIVTTSIDAEESFRKQEPPCISGSPEAFQDASPESYDYWDSFDPYQADEGTQQFSDAFAKQTFATKIQPCPEQFENAFTETHPSETEFTRAFEPGQTVALQDDDIFVRPCSGKIEQLGSKQGDMFELELRADSKKHFLSLNPLRPGSIKIGDDEDCDVDELGDLEAAQRLLDMKEDTKLNLANGACSDSFGVNSILIKKCNLERLGSVESSKRIVDLRDKVDSPLIINRMTCSSTTVNLTPPDKFEKDKNRSDKERRDRREELRDRDRQKDTRDEKAKRDDRFKREEKNKLRDDKKLRHEKKERDERREREDRKEREDRRERDDKKMKEDKPKDQETRRKDRDDATKKKEKEKRERGRTEERVKKESEEDKRRQEKNKKPEKVKDERREKMRVSSRKSRRDVTIGD